MANLYFLIIGFLQIIKIISPTNGLPTIWVPLIFIVAVGGIKDLFEDLKRHKSDREENHRKTNLVKNGKIETVKWEQLRVGDIVKIKENEYFPADILLIQSGEKGGISYIETKNLDGETNLKHKKLNKSLLTLSKKDDNQVYY